jgi:hypothetical protein
MPASNSLPIAELSAEKLGIKPNDVFVLVPLFNLYPFDDAILLAILSAFDSFNAFLTSPIVNFPKSFAPLNVLLSLVNSDADKSNGAFGSSTALNIADFNPASKTPPRADSIVDLLTLVFT